MTREEAREKIRKLLALATSDNPNEAGAAAAMAATLMERYEILAAEVTPETETPMEQLDFGTMMKRLERWRYYLADVIAKAHGCAVCYNRRTSFMEIVGRRSDISSAETVRTWCEQEILRLTERHGRGRGLSYRNAFRLGCVWAVRIAIAEERRRLHDELLGVVSSRALVVVDERQKAAEEAMGKLRSRPSAPVGDHAAFAAGVVAAKDVYHGAKPKIEGGAR